MPGSDRAAYRFIQEIMSSDKTEAEDPGINEKKLMLKVLLLLKDFDEKMMQQAITQISSYVHILMLTQPFSQLDKMTSVFYI